MKSLSSFQELDALGEGLSRDYTKKTHRWNALCFDIEGFITDYLGLCICYESFAEKDSSKIGFLANGIDPLLVHRGCETVSVVFPKDTIVIERYLLQVHESSRKRFTMAHEASHKILERHIPMQTVACFHSDFDAENVYPREDLKRMFSLNETLTNRLGAAILMPLFLVEKALRKYNSGQPLKCYDGGVFAQNDKLIAQNMANSLGVSYSAFITRLRELNLLDWHPIEEYISNDLRFGGAYDPKNSI